MPPDESFSFPIFLSFQNQVARIAEDSLCDSIRTHHCLFDSGSRITHHVAPFHFYLSKIRVTSRDSRVLLLPQNLNSKIQNRKSLRLRRLCGEHSRQFIRVTHHVSPFNLKFASVGVIRGLLSLFVLSVAFCKVFEHFPCVSTQILYI